MSATVAFFAPYTEHVGTERVMLNLSAGFSERGYDTDLIRIHEEWPDATAEAVVGLDQQWSSAGIEQLSFPLKKLFLSGVSASRLVRYLRRERPSVVVAGLLAAVAIAARDLAGVDTKVLVSVQGLPQTDRLRSLLWPRFYPRADSIVAPVRGIADRTVRIAELDDSQLQVIPNPVITDRLIDRGQEVPDHPWFDGDRPVVVGVGRQTYQKDFSTLLRAFAEMDRDAHLVVPGKEGDRTSHLADLARQLGVQGSVSFPGFVDNPYAYIRAADVFVLSSRWEGPGHVLVEALALGTPVVATDCPIGPRDILDDGNAGILVPVGDETAMASAVAELLADPEKRRADARRGRETAERFRVERAVPEYVRIVEQMLGGSKV